MEWKVGDIVLQPRHGVVGRVAKLSELPRDGMDALPTLVLESGDELLEAGCVPGNPAMLMYHDGCIAALGATLKRLAGAGLAAGLKEAEVLSILGGVMSRQSAALQ